MAIWPTFADSTANLAGAATFTGTARGAISGGTSL